MSVTLDAILTTIMTCSGIIDHVVSPINKLIQISVLKVFHYMLAKIAWRFVSTTALSQEVAFGFLSKAPANNSTCF